MTARSQPMAEAASAVMARAAVATDAMLDTTLLQIIELLAIGTLAGTLGGLLGIGGGLIMIPGMFILLGDHFGPDSFHLYKLAAITTSIVVSVPAVARHHRAQAVVWPMLTGIVPLALVGIVVGVVGASYLSGEHTHLLRRAFGGFLELVVAWNWYQAWQNAHGAVSLSSACPVPSRRAVLGTVVGFPAGLIAGLLGIGGGAWAVPAQRLFLGIRLQNAIANSCGMIVAVATVTAGAQSIAVARMPELHPVSGWWLALWLAPGALLGGWCGAGLTHRLPTRWLRHAFHALLVVTGARLIFF